MRNELVADDDLEIAVAEALGRDPRTRRQRIQVDAFQGIVHLRGEVPTGEVLAAAEEVAAAVHGVRSV
ncbi:MAG: BON domain-containing protein, partial [Actinobacteria bacterium]|nr:BON domain-containing protein [Actinomycetota bacterium]